MDILNGKDNAYAYINEWQQILRIDYMAKTIHYQRLTIKAKSK